MYSKIRTMKWELFFVIMSAMNLYLLPIIAFDKMEGDKTDILMGLAFGFVPLGWFIIFLIYGFVAKKNLWVSCCAAILCFPLLFIRFVTGDTISEKIYALFLIITACFFITLIGIFIGSLLKKVFIYFQNSFAHLRTKRK